MMSKKMKIATAAVLRSCVVSSVLLTAPVVAGEALDAVNAEVEAKAAQMDQKYGVLLTYEERNALKLSLVAKKVIEEATAENVEQQTEAAIETFEITDPVDQRKLLIELQVANVEGNGEGITPPR